MSVVVIGAGGHAREVVAALRDAGSEPAGLLVEAGYPEIGTEIHQLPVREMVDWLRGHPAISAICAVGDPAVRYRLTSIAEAHLAKFIHVIHPSAVVGESVTISPGAYVGAQSVVTTDVFIGSHAHVNVGCTLSHDTTLGGFVTVSPGVHLAGGVEIEEGAFLGVGAVVLPNVRVGPWSVVAAGAVVTRDVAPNATVMGVPARATEVREQGWHLTK